MALGRRGHSRAVRELAGPARPEESGPAHRPPVGERPGAAQGIWLAIRGSPRLVFRHRTGGTSRWHGVGDCHAVRPAAVVRGGRDRHRRRRRGAASRVILPATSFGGVEAACGNGEPDGPWRRPDSLIRLSAGIERVEDLVADIDEELLAGHRRVKQLLVARGWPARSGTSDQSVPRLRPDYTILGKTVLSLDCFHRSFRGRAEKSVHGQVLVVDAVADCLDTANVPVREVRVIHPVLKDGKLPQDLLHFSSGKVGNI